VTRNSKEKKENVNRKRLATRSKRQAEQTASQAPTKRQTGASVTNRLAVTGHRRAVAARLAPCLVACAWRWDPSARRLFSLMCQVTLFLLFSRKETYLGHFGARTTRLGALGGLLGLVGTAPSSSLCLLPLPFPFCKLELSMTMES